jgi:ubiquitin C-terminal hydrolase
MIKSISTKEEKCFITIESQFRGSTTIWFVDELFDVRKRLATYKDGKWGYSSSSRMNDLVTLMKHNTKLRRALQECLNHVVNEEELPGMVNWRCFKRRTKLKVIRITRKINKFIKNNIEF